jgi:mannose-6-phosphate isomerase
MTNQIRDYAWGSHTALAALRGQPATGRPEADLWMGAHPTAPSAVPTADGGSVPLPELIEADPVGVLGDRVVAEFGPRLPFLLKILAIAEPLSVQVSPHRGPRRPEVRPTGARRRPAPVCGSVGRNGASLPHWTGGGRCVVSGPVDRATELLALFRSPRLRQVAEALAGSGVLTLPGWRRRSRSGDVAGGRPGGPGRRTWWVEARTRTAGRFGPGGSRRARPGSRHRHGPPWPGLLPGWTNGHPGDPLALSRRAAVGSGPVGAGQTHVRSPGGPHAYHPQNSVSRSWGVPTTCSAPG